MSENLRIVTRPQSYDGAHYSIFGFAEKDGMDVLRSHFPDAKADDMNFVIFSTSGVHGSYTTLKEIEESIEKYGDDGAYEQDDDAGRTLTVLIVHPRIVCLKYGNVTVTADDLPYLKDLARSSREIMGGLNG